MSRDKPHMMMTPLDPKGTEDRRWQCRDCKATGQGFNPLNATDCTAPPPPPCEWCGQTPICDLNCMGIKVLLAGPDIHVVGEPGAGIGGDDE